MGIKNKLTVTRGAGEGDNGEKKGKGQVKEQRTHGHRQCGGNDWGVGGVGQRRTTGKKARQL